MRIFFIIIFLISWSCQAQNSRFSSNTPPIMFASQSNLKNMKLTELDVDVTIHGLFSKTSMTMTFYNPNKRALAGDLVFPLPEGALVSGYALDVDGVMVDGSIVRKEKARRALETEIRKGIDPGLIEFTKGNNYRTRVFPIAAKGVRIIRVDYISDLTLDGSINRYHLPLSFKDKLKNFGLNINVLQAKSTPSILSGFNNVRFEKNGDGFVAKTKLRGVTLSENLSIEIPNEKNNNVVVEQASDGEFYFSIAHKAEPIVTSDEDAITPNKISIIWDASGSRKAIDHTRELNILETYLHKITTTNTDTVSVRVNLLRNIISAPKEFSISKGDSKQLINYLTNINYDGGTQLGEIDNKVLSNKADLHLIFTDGLSNFGTPFSSSLNVPTSIISSDNRSDHNLLRYIAETTGGRYFNLNKLKDDEVISGIGKSRYTYHSNESKTGKVTDVLPVASASFSNQFIFTGKLESDQSNLTLSFNNTDGSKNLVTIPISKGDASNGNLLRTVWAQAKVNHLLVHDKGNKEAFFKLGKEYGLVTPETSLIVLETIDQYVEHRISPPNSLPKMKEQYDERIAKINLKKDDSKEGVDRIEQILSAWKRRILWWETSFPNEYNKNIFLDGSRGVIEVVGIRASIQPSIEQRRVSTEIVDGLSADEIGDIPALSIGEALETITGASSYGSPAPRDRSRNLTKDFSEIELKPWSPKARYLKKLSASEPEDRIATYFKLRQKHYSSISFYLDCANFFYQQKNKKFALQVLSNITELELDNPALNRIVAHRLRQMQEFELSKLLFEEVIRLRPEEPQSYRDLAFVLAEQAQYDEAIEILYSIVLKEWGRFEGIETVVINELNNVIAQAKKAGVTEFNIDSRFIKLLDVDVRIVMTWDADLTDIDLHVIEPNGEHANYSNNLTKMGGLVSRDFTRGYGPEEYLIRNAEKGLYKIKANYYSNNSPSALGPVTVQLDIYTNYGRANEQHRTTTIQLSKKESKIEIGEVRF